MIVILAGRQGRTEKSLAAAMESTGLPGVLLMQQKVTSRGKTREIDAIFMHPRGVMTIEAKHTELAGQVVAYSSLWNVGGVGDPSLGDPESRASQQSKILASALTEIGHKHARVRGAVVVTGDKANMAVTDVTSEVRAGHIDNLKELIESTLGENFSYGVDDIIAIRDGLRVNPALLERAAVVAEWESIGAPVEIDRSVPIVVKRKKAEHTPIPTIRLLGYLSILFLAAGQLPSLASTVTGFGLGVLTVSEKLKQRAKKREKLAKKQGDSK